MDRGSQIASWLVAAGATLALIAMVAVSPPRPLYDEAWFLDTVRLIEREGLSVAFLRDFPGAAGPTFSVVFAGVDAVFGLAFPWLRLVNVALLLATAALITRCLIATTAPARDKGLIGAKLVVLPTGGVAAGLALTEMPAAAFAVLCMTLLAQAFTAQRSAGIIWSTASGIALAAAILGRHELSRAAALPHARNPVARRQARS